MSSSPAGPRPEGAEIRGKTVAIIGGGPAGAATAIRLAQLSRAGSLGVRVVLFEGKDFDHHYNQCVGVLSPPIEDILKGRLGVDLPYEIFKRQIFGYRLHAGGQEILLVGPHVSGATYAVRRVAFDAFLLSCAEREGVEVRRSRVTGVEFPGPGHAPDRDHRDRRERVYLFTESGTVRADAVVGAFGLDDGMIGAFETATRGLYARPRKFVNTYITKIHTDRAFIERKLGSIIYAYLFPPGISGLEFGAITPKGDHIIVNVAGEKATLDDFLEFLSLDIVRDHLPDVPYEEREIFCGKFPGAPARGAVGDRYLTVGDATGWLRPFKGKGINMAIETGILAAETMVRHGLGRAAFRRYEEATAALREDYVYGTWMRRLCRIGDCAGTLGTVLTMAKLDQAIHGALFNAVSGHDSFKNIIRGYARPSVLAGVVRNYLKERRRRTA